MCAFIDEQVDDAAEVVLLADRQLHGHDLRAERLLQELERVVEVGALAVEHVADDDAAEPARLGAVPEPLVLDFDAEHRVDDDERRLDDLQAGDGVGEEARVAGRVDEVEGETVAVDVRQTGREAHLALLLVVVPVGDRRAVGHGTQSRDRPGVEQQRLEQRRLAGTAVADESDVPDLGWVVHPGSPRCRSAASPREGARGGRSCPVGRMKSSTGDVEARASRRLENGLGGGRGGELARRLARRGAPESGWNDCAGDWWSRWRRAGAPPARVSALKPYFSRTLSTASPSATSRQPSSRVSWKALCVKPLTLTPTRRTQRAPTSSSSSSAVAVS